jgi:hypothetical protein
MSQNSSRHDAPKEGANYKIKTHVATKIRARAAPVRSRACSTRRYRLVIFQILYPT